MSHKNDREAAILASIIVTWIVVFGGLFIYWIISQS